MSEADGSLKIVMPTLAAQDVRPAVNVIDADSMQLVRTALRDEEVSVPAGKYLLSSMMPTGERSLGVADVSEGEHEEVTLAEPPVAAPIEGAPATSALESLGPTTLEPAAPALDEWFLRYACLGPQGLEETSVQTQVEKIGADGTVELTLRVAGVPAVVFVQVAAVGQVPQNVALPVNGMTATDSCRLAVGTAGQLTLSVSLPDNPLVDAVARYIQTGALRQAARLATQAEKLLEEKMADPYGAALGGYALLRLHELGRLHDWSTNLANFFPWLADGAIVAGEKAALEGDQVTAASWMGEAARRGLPAFVDGFSMLASRLREYGTPKAPPRSLEDACERARWTRRPAVATYYEGRFLADLARVSCRRPRRSGAKPDAAEVPPDSALAAIHAVNWAGGLTVLRIEMLPAAQGDALWIEYGDESQPRRILIDGGTKSSWPGGLKARVEALPAAERKFELLIVTHVDADHIDGALALLRDDSLGATFGDVWFNGWRHLPDTPLESLGPVEGELLTEALVTRQIPWNDAFGGRAVGVNVEGALPRKEFEDGLTLTVLSPYAQQLANLKPVWNKVVREAGLEPGEPAEETPTEPLPEGLEHLGPEGLPDVSALAATPFKADTAEANGSTIAVLLEHDGMSAVLCGDAFPTVVLTSVERLLEERGTHRLATDAFKLPHHGSHANISKELLETIDTRHFLFSSNGSHTRHPHPESVARALVTTAAGSSLFFNYRTHFNEAWDEEKLKDDFHYEAVYPDQGTLGLTVDL